jgi:hypothetical protein
MKRNFGKKLIIGAALCCLPFSAMALEALDDSALGGVTGQAGVSIALDDVVIYMKSIADVTYIDTDGFGSVAKAGIAITYDKESEKLITLGAILDGSKYGITQLNQKFFQEQDASGAWVTKPEFASVVDTIGIFDTSADAAAGLGAAHGAGLVDPTNPTGPSRLGFANGATGNFTNGISPLTIDVGEATALTAGWQYNTAGSLDTTKGSTVAGVTIGLPTVEISTYYNAAGETKAISLAETANPSASGTVMNAGKEFISIKKTGTSTMAILGGRLEIAPH